MNWDFNIAGAPRGHKVQVARTVKDKTITSGEKTIILTEDRRDEIILESKCGKVIKSYWIADEARWAGFAEGEQPVAWQPWPKASGGVPATKVAYEYVCLDDEGSGQ